MEGTVNMKEKKIARALAMLGKLGTMIDYLN